MLKKLKALESLRRRFGLRWLLFRLGYALRRRSGILRLQMPAYRWQDRPLKSWLRPTIPSDIHGYAQWRGKNAPAFFFDALPALPESPPWDPRAVLPEADRLLAGELTYFTHLRLEAGFPPDWSLDPLTGTRLDVSGHWTRIPEDGPYDIKYIWEPGRFSVVYPLARAYAVSRDERYPGAFWTLVEDWIERNPPELGPQWMCGQEASLRLMAWCFGLYVFRGSSHTTPERLARFTQAVGALTQRIYRNLDYAVSTRSNHTISEAFGVWLAGTLFPELNEASTYREAGRALLEREAGVQILPDGAYSMYSLNYHRFILHIYCLALRLGELNDARFSDAVYAAVQRSVQHLYQLIDPLTGQMPAFGSNDGALVLPLNTCDFNDYRPLLQLAHVITQGKRLFPAGPWDEDLLWLCGPGALQATLEAPLQVDSTFPDGGITLLHATHSRAAIRCATYRERPSHADQLHLDLWWHGQPIAVDAGTYLYNAAGVWQNGLARTDVHNTVTVDGLDQMQRLTRFTWGSWAEGRVLPPGSPDILWRAEHTGYTRLPDPVTHQRAVARVGEDGWLILDHLKGRQPHRFRLHWLLADLPYTLDSDRISATPSDLSLREARGSPGTARQGRCARATKHDASSLRREPPNGLITLLLGPEKLLLCLGTQSGSADLSIVRASPNSTRGWRSRCYGQKEPALSLALETAQPEVLFWTYFGPSVTEDEITRFLSRHIQ